MDSSAHPFTDPANQETPSMSAYRWLLILGFPENIAAASVMPKQLQEQASASGARATRSPFPPAREA